jgi:uncharacterized protein YjbJ (UPF0337 family)
MKDIKEFKANPPAPKPDWNIQKNKLKKQFPDLTDEDVRYGFGQKEEMMTKLQVKLGKTKEEFQSILDNL